MRHKYLTLLVTFLVLTCYNVYSQNNKQQHIISFYNLENLFDTLYSPEHNDNDFTPEGYKEWNSNRYWQKLENMSKVINDIGKEEGTKGGPSIVGICEVENKSVLEDLINTQNLKNSEFKYVHFDSPDSRGIDVALLYRAQHFKLTSAIAQPVYIFEPVTGKRIPTRDHLLVSGELDGKPVHFIVNHWPSRWGGQINSQPLRIAAAQVCRHLIDSITAVDSSSNVIVMGDLNDDPNNLSVEEYLFAGGDEKNLKKNQLYNCTYSIFADGAGTLKYRGIWNLFDQIIVSQSLLSATNGIKLTHTKIFNPDYLLQQEGKYKGYLLRTYGGKTYLNGYSDHFPSYIIIETN